MKKKLSILVAALFAAASIATPSHAAPLAVNVMNIPNITTANNPQFVAVPATNVIDADRSVAIVANADNGTAVTFSANGVKLVTALNTVNAPVTTASGLNSYTATSTGASITVYAYTTTTAVGYVTVTNGAYSTIVYIKGVAGPASNIALQVPSNTAVGTVPTISVTASDVFGNPVGNESISVTLIGSTFDDNTITKNLVTDTFTDVNLGKTLGLKSANLAVAKAGSISVVATDTTIGNAVAGLPAPVKSAIANFVVTDLAAQIASLQNQITALNNTIADNKAAADKSLSDAKLASDKALTDAVAAANKALADAKVVSDKELSDAVAKALADAKATSDKALADVKASYEKALADAKAVSDAKLNTAYATIAGWQVKYNNLVNAYNLKAKKYKFALTK